MKPITWLVLLVLPILVLTGCSYDDRDFTIYDAGDYKGEKDPLLAKNLAPELQERFRLVQTDR